MPWPGRCGRGSPAALPPAPVSRSAGWFAWLWRWREGWQRPWPGSHRGFSFPGQPGFREADHADHVPLPAMAAPGYRPSGKGWPFNADMGSTAMGSVAGRHGPGGWLLELLGEHGIVACISCMGCRRDVHPHGERSAPDRKPTDQRVNRSPLSSSHQASHSTQPKQEALPCNPLIHNSGYH